MVSGYYRFPTIHKNSVVFVCEDDLWQVPAKGGIARRLTSGLAEASHPTLSPDGRHLAFTGREEGRPEVYLMPAEGGPATRLTYLGGRFYQTAGWTADGRIIFASSAGQPFSSQTYLYTIEAGGGQPEQIRVGPARTISYSKDGGRVIGRNTNSPEQWKRYRGGTAGQIWIDERGDGDFRPLTDVRGNLAAPMWIGERIYFLSDHEGIGNIYSCRPDGVDIQRHTNFQDYYARNASTDGKRIVFTAGGDLYLYDPTSGVTAQIPVTFHSPQTQRNRKFVDGGRYLQSWQLHPRGHYLAVSSRGKAFTFANWEGAVLQHGRADGPRYRLLSWLNDGKRLVAVTDAETADGDGANDGGQESFVIFLANGGDGIEMVNGLDIGRPVSLAVNPKKDQVLFSNHRYELCLLDLADKSVKVIDRGRMNPISGFSWSPDGEWVAYSVSLSPQITILKLWRAADGEIFPLTEPVLKDVSPAFDPKGRFIYFLSHRYFDPVYDNMQFDLNFPMGVKPYLITLRKDQLSPFVPEPRAPDDKGEDGEDEASGKDEDKADEKNDNDNPGHGDQEAEQGAGEAKEAADDDGRLTIDLDGIEKRIVAFPVDEGRYGRIMGIKDGRVVYSRFPVEGARSSSWLPGEPPAKGSLYSYDFTKQKEERLISNISSFDLSRDGAILVYRAGNRLRVVSAGSKPDKDSDKPGRESGWIDLDRIKVSVVPATEWRQMYREAWRLQRDNFWTPNMSNIDWQKVYLRYLPLVERVASRSEFSDLVWEMQGELGTSHAYEFGGDYRPEPTYDQGYLGADFVYDETADAWQVNAIVHGDAWEEGEDSPLNRPGVNISVGDHLLAINGRRLTISYTPAVALVNMAGEEVALTVLGHESDGEAAEPRTVTVKALGDEEPARYRQWVEANRRYVHRATNGRIGYVHIPDMGPHGYAEFHRGYLGEIDRQGLIIDIRFNGGGHVSSLLLQKLARRRLAYIATRWGQQPWPYPEESVLGPMVALTNEFAGSDGDIFAHAFKMLGLGPLIGTRTWGGVIGIEPAHILVDGTITTQPEYSFWFKDVGWGVENYGTDPDVKQDNTPQDYIEGIDAQLERALVEIKALLADEPPVVPKLDGRPDLTLPSLPAHDESKPG